MALPSSGPISLSDVNVELGLSATAQISMGDSVVRTLFGIGSGVINMQNGRGKANEFAFTISSNQTNANLATLATNAGWNGSSKVVATIDSGIYIGSNSTGTPALTVNGSFAGGVELINNGTIVGMGGQGGGGGRGGNNSGLSAGGAGGIGLSASSAITVTNNGTIAGGGGGGGGGAGQAYPNAACGPGGGGGGGGQSSLTNSSGGSGGGTFCSSSYTIHGGAGGAGTISSAGGAGGGGRWWEYYAGYKYGSAGASGGSWGAAGNSSSRSGGAGGNSVSGNSNITWVSTGTRYGGIS